MSQKHKGQSLVEFAIVLVLFLVILLGIIDWGFYLYSTIILDSAVRDGVRNGVTYNDWTTNTDVRLAEIRDMVEERANLLPAALNAGLRNRIIISFDPDINNPDSITVEIHDQPFNSLSGFFNIILPDAISTEATMRYERR